MKLAKTFAITGALALAAAVLGNAAFAATATPSANGVHARCEQQAKDKHLSGAALKDFLKKCEVAAPKK